MAEITNELICEVLKAMQARLGNVEEGIREVRGEVHALRGSMQATNSQIGALQLDISNIYQTMGAMDSRLSRIERRLDIIDNPVIGN
jgi:chromosome segregation ATPase